MKKNQEDQTITIFDVINVKSGSIIRTFHSEKAARRYSHAWNEFHGRKVAMVILNDFTAGI